MIEGNSLEKRIRKLCLMNSMSTADLEERAGISAGTLRDILRGKSADPRLSSIKKIAEGFNMSLSDFFDDRVFED